MGHDVSTNWLLGVNSVCHATARISHHLISHENGDVKLFADFLNPRKHSSKNLLSFSQLSSTRVINSVRSHDWINDHESKLIFNHGSCSLHNQIVHCIYRESSTNHDVVENLFRIESKFIGYLFNPLRSKSVLSVNIQNFALTSSTGTRKLSSHTQSVRQLSLSGTEFSEGFSDALALNPTL